MLTSVLIFNGSIIPISKKYLLRVNHFTQLVVIYLRNHLNRFFLFITFAYILAYTIVIDMYFYNLLHVRRYKIFLLQVKYFRASKG